MKKADVLCRKVTYCSVYCRFCHYQKRGWPNTGARHTVGKIHTCLSLSKTQHLFSGLYQTCVTEGPQARTGLLVLRPGSPSRARPRPPSGARAVARRPNRPLRSGLGGRGGGQSRGVALRTARAGSAFQIHRWGRSLSVRGSRCFSESLLSTLGPVVGMARECADGCGKRRGASGEEPNGSLRKKAVGGEVGGWLVNPHGSGGVGDPVFNQQREKDLWLRSGLKGQAGACPSGASLHGKGTPPRR